MKLKLADDLALPADEAVTQKEAQFARRRIRDARWRADNRAKVRAYFREYAAVNTDRLKAYHADYFQANKPARVRRVGRDTIKKKAKDARYRARHRERLNATIAASKAAKPQLYRAISVQSSLRRRARKRSLLVERVSWKRLRAAGRCHLCGLPIESRSTFDHLIPIVRGGAHAEWNLMQAHDRCNKSRGTKPLFNPETKEEAERYIASRMAQYSRGEGVDPDDHERS